MKHKELDRWRSRGRLSRQLQRNEKRRRILREHPAADSLDYQSISDLLEGAHGNAAGELVLDFRNLQFLNSAGINTISKFVISARKSESVLLKVLGNEQISWQQKSLKNLQKLWSKVQIVIS